MNQWMKGKAGLGWAVLLSAGVVLPAAAQFGGGGGGGLFGGGSGFSRRGGTRPSAREKLQQIEAELALLEDNLRTAQARYEAGQSPIGEVKNVELELLRARGQLAEARVEANREKRLEELNRYVDIDLQGATVRQAAQALSKASGVPIQVDSKITDTARITVRGRGVPVAVLLDRLGNRANLMISPSEDGRGVDLQTWPALELEGERTLYKGPLAPWSTEWGTIPITGAFQAQVAASEDQPAERNLSNVAPPRGGSRTPPSGSPGSRAGGEGSGFAFPPGGGSTPGLPGMSPGVSASAGTSIGVGNGSIVVAEPGVKDGHAGLWLTVYKLSGTSLLKIGTGFHRSGGAPNAGGKPRSGGMGMGGMMGGFGGGPEGPAGGGGLGGFGGGGFGGGFGGGGLGGAEGGFGGAPGAFPGGGGFGGAVGAPPAPSPSRTGKTAPAARRKAPAKPAPNPSKP